MLSYEDILKILAESYIASFSTKDFDRDYVIFTRGMTETQLKGVTVLRDLLDNKEDINDALYKAIQAGKAK